MQTENRNISEMTALTGQNFSEELQTDNHKSSFVTIVSNRKMSGEDLPSVDLYTDCLF